jgi:hypothetical protein
MSINNRQQVLVIVAIAAFAFWAGGQLVYSPLARIWKQRSARIAELRRLVDQGSKLLERAQFIRPRWENMRANTLSSEVSAAESQVFKAFERWSQDSQITITSIRPQWKRNADDYMTLECRVEAAGNLSTLTRFLYDVEKDPLACKVDAVELNARDNNGQQFTLGLQVNALLLSPPGQ